jgi:hypothetical protein
LLSSLGETLRQQGIWVLVHTVNNEPLRSLLSERGARSFYTDALAAPLRGGGFANVCSWVQDAP